jgi:sodium/potassium-transporting ATPase subunit alpha
MFVSNVAAGLEVFLAYSEGNQYATKLNTVRGACAKKSCSGFQQLACLSKLCNNSHFIEEPENHMRTINQREATGDATDIALLKFSALHLENSDDLGDNYTELLQVPFNSRNKWMMKTVQIKDLDAHNKAFGDHLTETASIMMVKGAPDRLLSKCGHILKEDGSEVPLNSKTKMDIIQMQNEWCIQGQRVLLLCKKRLDCQTNSKLLLQSQSEIERYVEESTDFCLIGMAGIIDPPREGISNVIKKCRQAGIRVLMVAYFLVYILNMRNNIKNTNH